MLRGLLLAEEALPARECGECGTGSRPRRDRPHGGSMQASTGGGGRGERTHSQSSISMYAGVSCVQASEMLGGDESVMKGGFICRVVLFLCERSANTHTSAKTRPRHTPPPPHITSHRCACRGASFDRSWEGTASLCLLACCGVTATGPALRAGLWRPVVRTERSVLKVRVRWVARSPSSPLTCLPRSDYCVHRAARPPLRAMRACS
jgi:hypothetical protein